MYLPCRLTPPSLHPHGLLLIPLLDLSFLIYDVFDGTPSESLGDESRTVVLSRLSCLHTTTVLRLSPLTPRPDGFSVSLSVKVFFYDRFVLDIDVYIDG